MDVESGAPVIEVWIYPYARPNGPAWFAGRYSSWTSVFAALSKTLAVDAIEYHWSINTVEYPEPAVQLRLR